MLNFNIKVMQPIILCVYLIQGQYRDFLLHK
jgi:hypothetical protein